MEFCLLIPDKLVIPEHGKYLEQVVATALLTAELGHTVTLLCPACDPIGTTYLKRATSNRNTIKLRMYLLPGINTKIGDFEAELESRINESLWKRLLQDIRCELFVVVANFPEPTETEITSHGTSLIVYVQAPPFTLGTVPPFNRINRAEYRTAALPYPDKEATTPIEVEPFPTGGASNGDSIKIPPLFCANHLRELIAASEDSIGGINRPTDLGNDGVCDDHLTSELKALKLNKLQLAEAAIAAAFNEGPFEECQLLLDVSVIVENDAKTGIQRVVRSLLHELLGNPPLGYAVRPIYFRNGLYFYANQFRAKFGGREQDDCIDEPVDARQHDVYLALDLNTHLVEPAARAHTQMKARGVDMNFIVYDILLVHHPEWWPAGTNLVFERWLTSITKLADRLICISSAVADDVRNWLEVDGHASAAAPTVSSFHLGADVESSMPTLGISPEAEDLLRRISMRPTFLMVGTIEPRKGHRQSIAAFQELWAEGLDVNLVIVGKPGWLVDDLCTGMVTLRNREPRFFWLDGISDEYLQRVYQHASCLIVASEGEGFGLPLIEAAHVGLPILARDLPVFREVAGPHAAYFSGLAPHDLAVAVRSWLDLSRTRSAPESRNMPWLTWHQSAGQLLAALGIAND